MFIIRNLPDAMFRFRPDDPPQGGDGGNSGQGNSNQGNTNPPASQGTQGGSNPPAAQGAQSGQPEVPQGLATMIAKNDNNALKVAEILHGDNYQLREKNRQLQAQIEGAVVLRDADKTAYEQYKTLGAPNEIATKLRQGELERIAGKAGYNAQVFADLDRMAGGKLQYEVKTETVDGNAAERVYVKDISDPNAQPQLLGEYAAAKWAAYLPALQPTPPSQGQGSNGNGVRFPTQHPGGGTPAPTTKNVAENTLNKAYSRKDK